MDSIFLGDEIVDQLAEEFAAEETLQDDGVGERNDMSYSERLPDPVMSIDPEDWMGKRSLWSAHLRK
jgi:hypothetical protein